MSYYYGNRGGGFLSNVPQVTRNIVIINIIMFAGTWAAERLANTNIMGIFALYSPASSLFRFWQPISYMFMHGGFFHILFNMYTLVIFGSVVEQIIGPRKYLVFYLLSGLGAAALHLCIMKWMGAPNIPMVGASGAIYGVLIAYALLFPDSRMTLLFPPVTLSAKWMVAIFAGIELFTGVTGSVEGVAHFAHLGGMIVGLLIILYWKKRRILFDQDTLI